MQQVLTFNWIGLLQLIVLWMLIVFVAVWVLDWLFPPLHRDESELPTSGSARQPNVSSAAVPIATGGYQSVGPMFPCRR